MARRKLAVLGELLFGLLVLVAEASTVTHWVVTENGKIEAVPDTVFQMKKPDDLISFLEQENRRDSMEKLVESMQTRRAKIDEQFYSLHSTKDIEDGLKMTDSDCLSKGHYDADLEFQHSNVIDGFYREGIKVEDFGFNNVPIEDKTRVPDCKTTFPLDFSMYTFEHLSAMRNRMKLNQKFEIGLIKYIPFTVSPDSFDLNLFGHQVAHGLIRNNTSWLHLHLASIYWRIKGDAYNALECTRRAIVKASKQFRDIPLQTTADIFHAANYSREATIVLHNAIEYAPTESIHHLTLANIYASMGEYNKSVEYYDNAIKYNPNLDVAKKAKHSILCNLKLESSLSALHQQLLDILNELRAYHNEQTEYLNYQEKLNEGHVKPLNSILLQPHEEMHYESLDTLLTRYGQACVQRGVDDPILSCDVASEKKAIIQQLQLDYGISLQILKTVEVQAKEIRNKMIKAKLATEDLEQFNQLPDYSKFSTVFMEPTDRPKYHKLQIKKSNEPFEKPEWPSESYCESLIPFDVDVKQYVPVYLPPENKGYVTYLFVSELIGLDPGKEHPLPWRPPMCKPPKSFNLKYIPPELVKSMTGYNVPDTSLQYLLTGLVQDAEGPEIGQRILTAMNSKVAAPWVLSMLASLYWRVKGEPRNALDCLQLALDTVPNKFKDVPLISIASISHRFHLIDNGLSVTEEAFRINSVEPMTNFLYGLLLNIKGNYSGAIHHLKQTLRVEPHAMNGRAMTMLQTIACQEKFSSQPPEVQKIFCVTEEISSCSALYPKGFSASLVIVFSLTMDQSFGINGAEFQHFYLIGMYFPTIYDSGYGDIILALIEAPINFSTYILAANEDFNISY